MKKRRILAAVVALAVVAAAVFYFTRPAPVVATPPANPDLGTRGGATQVNMETH